MYRQRDRKTFVMVSAGLKFRVTLMNIESNCFLVSTEKCFGEEIDQRGCRS